MNLCRVLPNGMDAKLAVDEAIDASAPIGNLRDDIFRCAACNLLMSVKPKLLHGPLGNKATAWAPWKVLVRL